MEFTRSYKKNAELLLSLGFVVDLMCFIAPDQLKLVTYMIKDIPAMRTQYFVDNISRTTIGNVLQFKNGFSLVPAFFFKD